MLDFEEVKAEIKTAMVYKDHDAIVRGLSDLLDCGMSDIKVHFRHITPNGLRMLTEITYPELHFRVSSPDKKLTKAEVLIWRIKWMKDINRIERKERPKYFKHENDMSPEEYAWVKDA